MAITIAIATNNRVKISAIKKALECFLPEAELVLITSDVNSNVESQPFDERVHQGAENRLNNLKEMLKENQTIDYFIACEGGIINLYGNYYNVHFVMVEDKNGHKGEGLGQGYPIPKAYIEEIKKTSLAQVLDRLFNGNGGIRVLTNGARTREDLIKEAALMAVTAVMNGEMWHNF